MRRRQDVQFVALAALHGAALFMAPVAPFIAVGVWWNSNTIAHNFVHRPFFQWRPANVLFSLYQSVLLGIPQTLWRERHMAHHADRPWRWRWSVSLAVELALILAAWGVMAASAPLFFSTTYLPAYLAGLGLCAVQGHFEHVGAVTTSHYGRIYNLLCFNDGYHCEHHAFPGVHWSELPARTPSTRRASAWPPLLRWVEAVSLDGLERLALHSPRLQRFMVQVHTRAMADLLSDRDGIRHIAIVGGGLFPRTALALRDLVPHARVVIIDANPDHLDSARAFLEARPVASSPVSEFRHETFVAGQPCEGFDLVVVPLALRGDRRALYDNPPAPLLLAHDWCWRMRGTGRLVSLLLLKRLNLVRRHDCRV
jgi:hypothetical protein